MVVIAVDCSQAGDGELTVDITHNGRSIPGSIQSEGRGIYRACFLPQGPGVYTIRVYFAGMEVQGEYGLSRYSTARSALDDSSDASRNVDSLARSSVGAQLVRHPLGTRSLQQPGCTGWVCG